MAFPKSHWKKDFGTLSEFHSHQGQAENRTSSNIRFLLVGEYDNKKIEKLV